MSGPTSAGRAASPVTGDRQPASGLRMTRGARQAATGMPIADGDMQRCLDAPDDVSPHPDTPSRTRFRRGTLAVRAGADGMVLRVGHRDRADQPAARPRPWQGTGRYPRS